MKTFKEKLFKIGAKVASSASAICSLGFSLRIRLVESARFEQTYTWTRGHPANPGAKLAESRTGTHLTSSD